MKDDELTELINTRDYEMSADLLRRARSLATAIDVGAKIATVLVGGGAMVGVVAIEIALRIGGSGLFYVAVAGPLLTGLWFAVRAIRRRVARRVALEIEGRLELEIAAKERRVLSSAGVDGSPFGISLRPRDEEIGE